MRIKVERRNIGDVGEYLRSREQKIKGRFIDEQKSINKVVSKSKTIREELKTLEEQLKLPVGKRSPALFRKYGRLLEEEPVQQKLDLLKELPDQNLEEVVDAIVEAKVDDIKLKDPIEVKIVSKEEDRDADPIVTETMISSEEPLKSIPDDDDNSIKTKAEINKNKVEENVSRIAEKENELAGSREFLIGSKHKSANDLSISPVLSRVFVGVKPGGQQTRLLSESGESYVIIAYLGKKPNIDWKKLNSLVGKNNNSILNNTLLSSKDRKELDDFIEKLEDQQIV